MAAGSASVTLSGANVGLLWARLLSAGSGALALTVRDAGLSRAVTLTADPGAFLLSAADADLSRTRVLLAETAVFLLTFPPVVLFADQAHPPFTLILLDYPRGLVEIGDAPRGLVELFDFARGGTVTLGDGPRGGATLSDAPRGSATIASDMKRYQIGDAPNISLVFSDTLGLANPGDFTVYLQQRTPANLLLPEITKTLADCIHNSVGDYTLELEALTSDDVGQWYYRTIATGAVECGSQQKTFMVEGIVTS